MKNKDETLEKTQEDNYALRSKLTQSDTTISVLQSDNNSMRTRLATLESDVSAAKININHLEPLINRLEPELNQLKSEKVENKIELTKLNSEILQLRPIHQLLADLNKDISDSTKVLIIPSTLSSPSSKDSNDNYNEPSLSQQHAAWTGLPSLRHLSPQLYDRVRRIAQDLHRKEIECKEYEMKCSSLSKELAIVEKNNGEEVTRLLAGAETSNRAVDEIKSKLNQIEEELNRYRIARTTLDQLRVVLQSFPGGISVLLGSTAFTMDGGKSSNVSEIKFNPNSDEEIIKVLYIYIYLIYLKFIN
jgi:septal ring factor EnvC (AmiA/AmiB activator)